MTTAVFGGGGLGSFFAIFSLGSAVFQTVSNLYIRLTQDPDISGDELVSDVSGALQAVQALLPHAKITPAFVKAIADAVAQAIKDYHPPVVPVPPPAVPPA